MSSNYVPPPKSQYEIERDERIARNEAFMRSLGLGGGLGAVVPQLRRPAAAPRPKRPRDWEPREGERKSSRLAGEPAPDLFDVRRDALAEADAEAKHLQGKGIAMQRKAIADGLAESAELVQGNMENMSSETVMALLLLTQYFDTLQSMAEASDTRTIFLPHSPSGMNEIYTQVQNAVMVGEGLQASGAEASPPPSSDEG